VSGRPHPESERPLHGPLQSFNLDEELARLRQEEAWQQGQRNAITLRKGQGLNVVLLVMRGGDRLEEHSAPGPISLSVREGRVRFTAADSAHVRCWGSPHSGGPGRCCLSTHYRGQSG